jgi:hypothetical protein
MRIMIEDYKTIFYRGLLPPPRLPEKSQGPYHDHMLAFLEKDQKGRISLFTHRRGTRRARCPRVSADTLRAWLLTLSARVC